MASGQEPIEIESSPEPEGPNLINGGPTSTGQPTPVTAPEHGSPVVDAEMQEAGASPSEAAADDDQEESEEDESEDEEGAGPPKITLAERLAELSAIDALLATVPRHAADALNALNPANTLEERTTRAKGYAAAAESLLDALESATARLKRSVRALEENEVVVHRMGIAATSLPLMAPSTQAPFAKLAEALAAAGGDEQDDMMKDTS